MHRVSVSNLESFRQWRNDEDLEIGWLLDRLLGKSEQTPAMAAGTAFHKAIELAPGDEDLHTIQVDGYQFDITCDIDVAIPKFREIRISKEYGDVLVVGRVDALNGKQVDDHKTTQQFDADRLMGGYQWRYYLDMLDADTFKWNVFVMRENDDPKHYTVVDYHELTQRRYPELRSDCEKLAADFSVFAKQYLPTIN